MTLTKLSLVSKIHTCLLNVFGESFHFQLLQPHFRKISIHSQLKSSADNDTQQLNVILKEKESIKLADATIASKTVPTERNSNENKQKSSTKQRPTYTVFGLPSLSEGDCKRRVEFASKMLELLNKEPEIIHSIIFSDEGNFWPFSSKNRFSNLVSGPNSKKKNTHHNKKFYHESRPLPCIVWAGMTTKEIIGPYFFNSHVTANTYLVMLRKYLLPQLINRNYNLSTTWFQQDSSPPHRSLKVLSFLKEAFGPKLISYKSPTIAWPARSQDLTPLDYFFWDHMKSKMKDYTPKTEENLRECLTFEMEAFESELLRKVVHEEFIKRLKKCVEVRGARFEMESST